MKTYDAIKTRIFKLLDEKNFTIHRLALESSVSPSTIKNILYGKSTNPGLVTIKMLCDGFKITLEEFVSCPEFKNLDSEIE